MQWIVSSSVLILVVIALRYVLRGKLSLRMQYALWLLVLVRLLVPVSFGASDLSVMNAVPERAPTVQLGTDRQDIVGERNDAPANAGTVGIPAQSMNEAAPPNLVQNVTTATVTAPTVEKTDWARIAKTVWLAGAAALGQYKPYFDQDDVEVLFVVNAFRPLSGDADSVCDLMLRVAGRSRLSPTAVINNANVAWETEESDLVRGEELLREVSTRMNLPIGYLCAKQDILDKLPDHLSGERIAIDILMRPEWME